jgi:hypothetical protein
MGATDQFVLPLIRSSFNRIGKLESGRNRNHVGVKTKRTASMPSLASGISPRGDAGPGVRTIFGASDDMTSVPSIYNENIHYMVALARAKIRPAML